ncbi:cytochrome c-type biogenesis protein CcmH [Micromonospora rhizosphaerae]|uniref:Cytochrome c-type biogenesis protein n=1 Tax=Micromonospora rhizosphaerae TaxID=568872 RepID=A0A1C6STG2_9ACTN|nr:cytochrome c-type biogenesis protein CcmH [Micromonospora rhizosphaerae]SCL32886.1 cytochrome c-type biogenesis protein CcmH [Micromonospora rhizosphaerae]
MRWRGALGSVVMAALLAAALVGLIRSGSAGERADPVRSIAAGLRCPACQGESVADSRSPIAAAMRQVVADQVAQGRPPDEIRRWFVQRYGEDVLADPPLHGPALLLWVVPLLVLLAAGFAAVRTLRPARRRSATRPITAPSARAARLAWRAGSLGLVAIVASVALAATRVGPTAAGGAAADPAAVAVLLARDLEQQQQYGAAADLYRQALRTQPDDSIRLRLAFTLVRAGDPAGAEQMARQVLTNTPDSPDALLVLGLAQREADRGEADATLRRFLAAAPDHPAAAEIRRLLAARP